MAQLSICLLGAFQVTLDERPCSGFESDKVRALLAYLAVETERPQRREVLADLLWPNSSERAARTNLRHVLANLRHVIKDRQTSPPFLHITRQTIQFNPASNYKVDVARFSALVLANSQLATASQLATYGPASSINSLEEAVALYQGPFLAGFSLADSAPFEEWQLLTREHLARQMLAALKGLIGHYEARGVYQQALAHAWRQVELEPWLEESHQQVMRLLALTGQPSLALIQYETCRRLLAEVVGVEPTPETRALYEQILASDLAVESVAPLPPCPSTPLNNLPLQLTAFVGRRRELGQIGERLKDPACRLLTLVGAGGSGKTRLAIQAGQTVIDDPNVLEPPDASPGERPFRDGVYFVPLVSLSSPDFLVPAIAEALSFTFYRQVDLKQQLLDYLREKEMLLILDNFEHLLAGATLLTDILLAAPRVKIIVTSREVLDLHGEWLLPLAGMASPQREVSERGTLDQLKTYDAIRLFDQCARRARPDFDLAAEGAHVGLICRLVDGLPLGIELAAAWLKLLSCAQIATEIEKIERSLDFLATTQRNVPARHRSIRAVFEYSWALLPEVERVVLRRLSIFRGGFRPEGAEQVAGATLPILATLVEKSLLQSTPAGRYHLHELLRQFAAEKLRAAPEDLAETQDRHSAYYLHFLQQREWALKGKEQMAVLAEIGSEIENARAAWESAVAQTQVARLEKGLETLAFFYHWQGRYPEGKTMCRLVTEKLALPAAGAAQRVLGQALIWQGVFCHQMGETDLAKRLSTQSLDNLASMESADQKAQRIRAFALLKMGAMAMDSERELGKGLLEQSLALYRALGDRWGQAEALDYLGWVMKFSGLSDEARSHFEESLVLRRLLGDQKGIADSFTSLGNLTLAVFEDRFAEAEQFMQAGLAIYREIGHRPGIAQGLADVGEAYMWSGKFAAAQAAFAESLDLYNELGTDQSSLATRQMSLGFIEMHLGRYQAARKLGQLSLALARQEDSHFAIAFSLFLSGNLALVEENFHAAQRQLQESVGFFRGLGQGDELTAVLMVLSLVEGHCGNQTEARKLLVEALQSGYDLRLIRALIYVLSGVALHMVDQDEPERAVDLYALVTRHPHVANSRWFEDVIGRHITAAAATLSPQVVAAAQERGRARDLWETVADLLANLTSRVDAIGNLPPNPP